MKIRIEKILSLDDGEHRFHYAIPGSELGIELKDFEGHEIFDRDVVTNVVLNKSGHTYYVKFSVTSQAHLLCDRCLDEIRREIAGDFSMVFAESRTRTDDEDAEVRSIDTRQTNDIVLDKDVMDTLMLAMPSKSLCREDCKGLCPECGVNWNDSLCRHYDEIVNEKI
ncbi:DUF177 domain-containing protein [bacterium]|nr:DUF177 domain-containing protein [bacterium]